MNEHNTTSSRLRELPRLDLSDLDALESLKKATVYLAAPYFSTDREVVKTRVGMCNRAARQLVGLGIPAFSPCTYTAQWQGDDLNGDFVPAGGWYDVDLAFLRGCRAMIVFMLPGVENSKGVAMELEYAKESGMPVYRLEEEDIIGG